MKPNQWCWTIAALLSLLGVGSLFAFLARDPLGLRQGLKDRAADFWIYDDLEAGYARARQTGKPLLVSFRCVP